MPYFVMTCNGVFPSAALARGPDIEDAPWFHGGKLMQEPVEPLEYTLDPTRPGNIPVMFDDSAYPLMRDDLVEALQAAGVDNLQLFSAVIKDPTTGIEHRNFKAFNIVGVVAAADMEASTLMGTSNSEMIDVDFDRLAIDQGNASRFRLFRLAENVSAIIVDEAVREQVESRAIPGMVFYEPADWSG